MCATNTTRVFSFLSPATSLKGGLPKGSGLDKFLSAQREEIVMSLDLISSHKMSLPKRTRRQRQIDGDGGDISEGRRNSAGGGSRRDGMSGSKRLRAVEHIGEARLGLGQFRNDHVDKVWAKERERQRKSIYRYIRRGRCYGTERPRKERSENENENENP